MIIKIHPPPPTPMISAYPTRITKPRRLRHREIDLPRRDDVPTRGKRRRARRLTPSAIGLHGFANALARETATRGGGSPVILVHGWKRCLDLFCIVVSLPVILPLLVLIALWIKLVSQGPALLRQVRIGRNGKPFVLYKFRSMVMNVGTFRQEAYVRHLVTSDRPMLKLDLICDNRVIFGGCMLRAAGLDELPQLLNVLRGEMSIVGPRPCLPGEYGFYSETQRERFKVLPGLTGIWQVTGKNQATFREMNVMDIHYARHASVMMDLKIMAKTPAALLEQMLLAFQQSHTLRRQDALQASTCDPERHYTLPRQS